MNYYNWIYTTSNENEYILFLIIVILGIIILNFNLYKTKTDKFFDITTHTTTPTTTPTTTTRTTNTTTSTTPSPSNTTPTPSNSNSPSTTRPKDYLLHLTPEQIKQRRRFMLDMSNTNPYDDQINEDNKINNARLGEFDSLYNQSNQGDQDDVVNDYKPYIKPDQINSNLLSYGISKLDGDQETIPTPTSTKNYINDIMQSSSDLYTSMLTGNCSIQSNNYDTIGNYATLDSLGSSMTDTLGGIKMNLGYTLLDEQLGTFKNRQQNNPYAYDNTADYQTGINPDKVDGIHSYNSCNGGNGSPLFLQKDFTGVANIFAPNIIIANPPLNSDGLPDISYKM